MPFLVLGVLIFELIELGYIYSLKPVISSKEKDFHYLNNYHDSYFIPAQTRIIGAHSYLF